MIENKRVLALIPARGGSKGVPRKNIREVAGKPLIAWTILEAQKSKYIDRLILSSEDAEIIAVAKEWGCDVPFVRPEELAQDTSKGMDPVLHAMEKVTGYDLIVLLQVTSPMRKVSDIDACIERCLALKAKACVSVTPVEENPFWMYTVAEHKLQPLLTHEAVTHRQDLPEVFIPNGAVFVAESPWLKEKETFFTPETVAYVMPRERSLDVDTEEDLKLAAQHLASQITS